MRPGTPDIGDPSSRRRPSSLRTPQLQILPIRTRFSPNLGRFAPQISFPDFGGPETRDFELAGGVLVTLSLAIHSCDRSLTCALTKKRMCAKFTPPRHRRPGVTRGTTERGLYVAEMPASLVNFSKKSSCSVVVGAIRAHMGIKPRQSASGPSCVAILTNVSKRLL